MSKSDNTVGLGRRHKLAAAALKRAHTDGAPCAWCGQPMYLDRTRNWDYNPAATNPANGSLHADHGEMSRAEAILRGVPIPLPNRLIHGRCNAQRGIGGNDHLAPAALAGSKAADRPLGDPLMEWPW